MPSLRTITSRTLDVAPELLSGPRGAGVVLSSSSVRRPTSRCYALRFRGLRGGFLCPGVLRSRLMLTYPHLSLWPGPEDCYIVFGVTMLLNGLASHTSTLRPLHVLSRICSCITEYLPQYRFFLY